MLACDDTVSRAVWSLKVSELSTVKFGLLNKIALSAVLALAVCLSFRGEIILNGDGLEYIVQTQSLVFDRSLSIETSKRSEYWNQTNPFERLLQETAPPLHELSEQAQALGGFGGLYPDRFGDWRYYHFFTYALFAAPLYWLFHFGQPLLVVNEYEIFRVFNIICLVFPLLYLGLQRTSLVTVITAILLFLSPLIPYTDWQHPELLLFALILFSLSLALSPRYAPFAPVVLGIAATQNIPIALFFPLLALLR